MITCDTRCQDAVINKRPQRGRLRPGSYREAAVKAGMSKMGGLQTLLTTLRLLPLRVKENREVWGKSSVVNADIFERAKLNNDATVTLYDWMAKGVRDGRNLIATDRKGAELWRAKPVMFAANDREDCFTRILWDGKTLTAFTWSGYKVSVDPDDGSVTVIEFVK